MRIERLRVSAFGPLRGLDTGPGPLPGFVVVLGPNEAGKSSLLEAVRALNYGIYPASRDRNPWNPWDGTEGSIEGWIRSGDGRRIHVHRRILATPWARIRELDADSEDGAEGEGEARDLRNDHVPFVDHVPQAIHDQVHTVTLPELMALQEGPAWQTIRDRIIAGMGTRDLAPPRVVAKALEDEAHALWRPTRQGKPLDRELEARLRVRSTDLKAARDRDRALREAREALERVQGRLGELRRERGLLDGVVRRERELRPLEGRIRHLDEVAARRGDPAALAGLPRDPRARWEELEKAVLESERALEEATAAVEALGGPDADDPSGARDPVLEAAATLEGLGAEARGADDARDRTLRLREELRRADARVREGGAPLLEEGAVAEAEGALEALTSTLSALPLERVRSLLLRQEDGARRVAQVDELVADHRRREPPDPAPPRPASTVRVLVGTGVLLALVALAVLLAGTGDPRVAWAALLAGLVVAGVGGWLALGDRRTLEAARARREGWEARGRELEARIAELQGESGRVRTELLALLQGIPLRPDRLASAGEGLASELGRLLDALRDRARAAEALASEEDRVHRFHDRVTEAAAALGLPGPDPELPPSARVAPLLDRLARAREARKEEEEQVRRRAAAVEEQSRAARRASEERERRGAFLALLREVDGNEPGNTGEDPATALIPRIEARLEAAGEHRHLRSRIEAEHGPLDELRSAVAGLHGEQADADSGSTHSTERLADAEARLEALEEEIEEAAREESRQRTLLEAGRDGETADLVESGIEAIREARREAREERDRLWVLSRLVSVAERRFREAHQPELVRRAEAHLGALTGGRYDTLVLGEPDDPDALAVRGPHLEESLRVEAPLSTGTREQTWFALRLAVVELVEAGGDPLPLVLDEVLVNWDPDRRGAALEMLAHLSRSRQIFLLTCHPRFAREAEARGARVLELPAPGGAP